jgi:hypothetical protein
MAQEKRMRIKTFFGALAVAIASMSAPSYAGEVRGVVEIFTSQGCSDCPPADKAFSAVIGKNGVLGLAWHVDYWDYLGWRDTFSSAQATARQRSYGKGNYTPEVIVNGTAVIANSRSSAAISSALGGSLPVKVSLRPDGGGYAVEVGAGSGSASLLLVKYHRSKTVAIQRGENAGRNVTYQHPVIGARPIGSWNGTSRSIALKPGECGGGNGCAVLLQARGGRILGAAAL